MNWSAMNKQQRELLILKALAAVGLLVLGVYYGLMPLIGKAVQLRQRRQELEEQIEQADRLLKLEPSLRRQYGEQRSRLAQIIEQQLPPSTNPLLWASDFIHRHARAAGVAIERVEEIRSGIPDWAKPPERKNPAPDQEDGEAAEHKTRRRDARAPAPRHFAPFAVQVSAISGYERLKAFVDSLERDNPYLSLSLISIVARDTNPEQHQVRLTVEWPRHLEAYDANLRSMLKSE